MLSWFKQLIQQTPEQVKHVLQSPWQSTPLLSIDLELTGLDASICDIVSIGWQPVVKQCLPVELSEYSVCRGPENLSRSPEIHGITQSQRLDGLEVPEVLQRLLRCGHNHVWVFHNAALDMPVLRREIKHYGLDKTHQISAIVTLDTLQLQRYLLQKSSDVIHTSSATLAACRQYFQLPRAPAHQALDDAFATAELVLAQLSVLSGDQTMPLQHLNHTGALQLWYFD